MRQGCVCPFGLYCVRAERERGREHGATPVCQSLWSQGVLPAEGAWPHSNAIPIRMLKGAERRRSALDNRKKYKDNKGPSSDCFALPFVAFCFHMEHASKDYPVSVQPGRQDFHFTHRFCWQRVHKTCSYKRINM